MNEDVLGIILAMGLLVGLPTIAMLLQHQRKMAEIIRDNQSKASHTQDHRLEMLEHRVEELNARLVDAILAADDQGRGGRGVPPPLEEIHQRLKSQA